ncbi:MAG: M28 family metallopeptidase [Armatimonadota bacterium]
MPDRINVDRIMNDIRHLSGKLGSRASGSRAEYSAGEYIAAEMRNAGCSVSEQVVVLPFGRKSRNIIGVIPGTGNNLRKVFIGAHYDSVPWSPGANDNASGTALLLEFTRIIPRNTYPFSVVLIGFGAEEVMPRTGGLHHFGSRQFVRERSKQEIRNMIGMISLDMVGAGSGLQIGHCSAGKDTLASVLRRIARDSGTSAGYFTRCNSDDAAFARRGVPTAHVRWNPDRNYHRPSDTVSSIDPEFIEITGSIILKWLNGLT